MNPAQAASDTAIFFQLLQLVGVPGIVSIVILPLVVVAMLLFLVIRMEHAYRKSTQAEDQKRWAAIMADHKEERDKILAEHKTERDRDFAHITELMENFAGHFNVQGKLVTATEKNELRIMHLGSALEKLPDLFRGIHQRFDTIITSGKGKGYDASRNTGHEGKAIGGQAGEGPARG